MKGLSDDEVRRIIRIRCKKWGAQRALARELNVSPNFINMVLHGKKKASNRLLNHLGLERVEFVRKMP